MEPPETGRRADSLVRADRRASRSARICGTRSRRGHGRRSTTWSRRSGSTPGSGCSTSGAARDATRSSSHDAGCWCTASTSANGSSSWPRRDAPPGATFERLDARATAVRAGVRRRDLPLSGRLRPDGRRRRRRRRRGRDRQSARAGRRARVVGVQCVLRGEVPRRCHVRRRERASRTSEPRSATRRARRSRPTCGPAATRRASCARSSVATASSSTGSAASSRARTDRRRRTSSQRSSLSSRTCRAPSADARDTQREVTRAVTQGLRAVVARSR